MHTADMAACPPKTRTWILAAHFDGLMWVFSDTNGQFSWFPGHQLCAQQFNWILTPTTQSQCRPQSLRVPSHMAAPYFRCQSQVLGLLGFWLNGCKSRVPMTPSSGPVICLEQLTEHRNILYFLLLVHYRGYFKGYQSTTRWRGTKGESKRVPSAGASVPWCCRYSALQGCRCVYQPRSSLNPITYRSLWRSHYVDMAN